MTKNYKLEVCAGSVQSAIEAEKGGAQRIELCAALHEGGTTPSPATIEMSCSLLKIPVYVIIRPRGGDFLYTDLEFEMMKRDIKFSKQMGAAGVVIGLLKADGTIDIERTKQLVDAADGMGVAYHRAFDMARDQTEALEAIIASGCERILTSGAKNKAFDGRDNIVRYVKQAAGRISIMAGSGVNPGNVKQLIEETGITEVHSSGKVRIPSGMQFKNTAISMGSIPQIPEYDTDETDAGMIRKIRDVLDTL